MSAAPPEVLLSRGPDVVERTLDDNTILYADAGRQILALDPIASELWRRLATAQALTAVCASLAQHFDVSIATVARDLQTPLTTLITAEVVRAELLHPAIG